MIMARIRTMLSGMPPTFRKIGSYILDHEQNVAFSSIYTIAESLEVSSASLVRFAKSLGLGGYQDLKREVQNEIRQRLSPADKVAMQELDGLSDDMRLQRLFQNEMTNLRNTFATVRPEVLAQMADGIIGARRIYACGFGATCHLARTFAYSLSSTVDREVSVIAGSVSDYAPVLKSFGPEDVMFAMTFPPYSAEVRHVASLVSERGGRLFLFTDSAGCPVYPLAQAVIRCDTSSLLLTNSYVGLVSTLNILVHLVFLQMKDAAARNRAMTIAVQDEGYRRIANPGAPPRGEPASPIPRIAEAAEAPGPDYSALPGSGSIRGTAAGHPGHQHHPQVVASAAGANPATPHS